MKKVSRREFLREGALGVAGGLAGLGLGTSLGECRSVRKKPEGALRFVHVTDSHMELGSIL